MDVRKLEIQLDTTSQRKVVNGRFKLLQSLGHGQFGKVLLAQDLSYGESPQKLVAIKTIHRVDTAKLITKTYMSHSLKIKREIRIMKECNHPNVVKLYQVIDDMKFDKILLVLEYCELGEIDWKRYNHYHERYFKDPSKSLPLNRVLRDVVNGLEYLHSYKHIIHRDLKPSNLLISSDRTIKISDFGVSLILENNANDERELGKSMGTPAFFAPELCQFVNNRLSTFNEADLRRSKVDARIDIWSLGVVLYCMFFHQLPFEGFNEFDLFKNIVNADLKFPKTRQSSSANADDLRELQYLEDLISKLLKKDPSRRPSLTEIKSHPFTTFGMTRPEIGRFQNLNKQIIASQSTSISSDSNNIAAESKLTQRLRKLFISRSEASGAADNSSSSRPVVPVLAHSSPENPVNVQELEKVDDLLDSYLDDSSSLSSLEGSSEPEVIDTSNLLASLDKPDSENSLGPPFRNSSPGDMTQIRNARGTPPPLKLSNSNFEISITKHKPSSSFSSGSRTPISSLHPVVMIGPESPSSMKSVFSPSRRLFARFKKKQPEPTISALSGKLASSKEYATDYAKLAPPPTFVNSWDNQSQSRSSLSSMDHTRQSSRKNSVSSVTSGSLSKISSSSSSLNLHAYLMESPSSDLHSYSPSDRSPDLNLVPVDDADTTCPGELSSGDEANRTMSMDEYLDRLE